MPCAVAMVRFDCPCGRCSLRGMGLYAKERHTTYLIFNPFTLRPFDEAQGERIKNKVGCHGATFFPTRGAALSNHEWEILFCP